MRPEDIYGRFPQLECGALSLRELTAADSDDVYRMFSDPEVTCYYDLDTFEQRLQARELIDRFRQRYDQGVGLRWAIVRRDEPHVVLGTCGYNIWIQACHRGLLGFDLRREYWRQGIMSQALTEVLRFGFESMALNRVEALTFIDNAPSQGLLEKLSFRREGVLRQYQFLKGDFVDMAMYSLLRSDR